MKSVVYVVPKTSSVYELQKVFIDLKVLVYSKRAPTGVVFGIMTHVEDLESLLSQCKLEWYKL